MTDQLTDGGEEQCAATVSGAGLDDAVRPDRRDELLVSEEVGGSRPDRPSEPRRVLPRQAAPHGVGEGPAEFIRERGRVLGSAVAVEQVRTIGEGGGGQTARLGTSGARRPDRPHEMDGLARPAEATSSLVRVVLAVAEHP